MVVPAEIERLFEEGTAGLETMTHLLVFEKGKRQFGSLSELVEAVSCAHTVMCQLLWRENQTMMDRLILFDFLFAPGGSCHVFIKAPPPVVGQVCGAKSRAAERAASLPPRGKPPPPPVDERPREMAQVLEAGGGRGADLTQTLLLCQHLSDCGIRLSSLEALREALRAAAERLPRIKECAEIADSFADPGVALFGVQEDGPFEMPPPMPTPADFDVAPLPGDLPLDNPGLEPALGGPADTQADTQAGMQAGMQAGDMGMQAGMQAGDMAQAAGVQAGMQAGDMAPETIDKPALQEFEGFSLQQT
jgi:hypothetical protein